MWEWLISSVIAHMSGIHQCLGDSVLVLSYELFKTLFHPMPLYANPCSLTPALYVFVHPSGGSMVLSGISCFFLWFGTSESMMIFMLCLYNGLSISAWNSLDVVTTESFPTVRRSGGTAVKHILANSVWFMELHILNAHVHIKHRAEPETYFSPLLHFSLHRGTGFGFCNALCKLSAVLGNLIFGSLVGITKAIPILMASSVLVGGGLVALRLPDTMANVLM